MGKDIFLDAVHKKNASGKLVLGTGTSIVCRDIMAETGVTFPEGHLHAEKMADLAMAGHTILGFDVVMPLFSVCHEAAAMGCNVNWGGPDMMPESGKPIFGDIDDDTSHISQYIMEHQGAVQVRKPEKHTSPKHFYVGGGNQTLNPLAHQRLEGYNLFNNITHLKHIGNPHESVLDRFLEPFKSEEKYDNKSFMDFEKTSGGSHNEEGGH